MTEEHKSEEGEGDSSEADAEKTPEELAAEREQLEKDIEGLSGTKKGLLKDVTTLRESRREARQGTGDDIETVGELLETTKKTSEDVVAPLRTSVDNISKSQKEKAKRMFTEGKDEYSASNDPDDAELDKIVSLAEKVGEESDQYDADLFYERLEDVYFARNRKTIQTELKQHRDSNAETEIAAAEIAATTGSGSGARPGAETTSVEITAFHRKEAQRLGKTPEEIAKLQAQYESSIV